MLGASSEPGDQWVAHWPLEFAQGLELLSSRVPAVGLKVLGLIDTTAIMTAAGYPVVQVRQLLAFHPRFMAPILSRDPSMAVHAPLKFTLLQRPTTMEIRCLDPERVFSAPGFEAMGLELGQLVRRVLSPPSLKGAGV
jgi:uncharacterized protein (DUF302 family)